MSDAVNRFEFDKILARKINENGNISNITIVILLAIAIGT